MKTVPPLGISTFLCATLEYVDHHKNVTLSLPEPLLRKFRIYAASENRSMSSLMTEAVTKMVDREGEAERRKKRLIESMLNAPDRGTGGLITWTRDELYER
jgi:hypothetical protein